MELPEPWEPLYINIKRVARCCFWRLGDRDLGSGLTGLDFSVRGGAGDSKFYTGLELWGGGGVSGLADGLEFGVLLRCRGFGFKGFLPGTRTWTAPPVSRHRGHVLRPATWRFMGSYK